MNPTLGKICAVWLIVLCVSPFTAPFSTCDLGDLHGGNSNTHGAVLKTTKAADESLGSPTVCGAIVPIFGAVVTSAALEVDRVAKQRLSTTILRL
jgi:hypothetical protein